MNTATFMDYGKLKYKILLNKKQRHARPYNIKNSELACYFVVHTLLSTGLNPETDDKIRKEAK